MQGLIGWFIDCFVDWYFLCRWAAFFSSSYLPSCFTSCTLTPKRGTWQFTWSGSWWCLLVSPSLFSTFINVMVRFKCLTILDAKSDLERCKNCHLSQHESLLLWVVGSVMIWPEQNVGSVCGPMRQTTKFWTSKKDQMYFLKKVHCNLINIKLKIQKIICSRFAKVKMFLFSYSSVVVIWSLWTAIWIKQDIWRCLESFY